MPPQSSDDLKETNARLDTVIKLLAAMYARELKNTDAILKLDNIKLTRDQIAEAVGVTTHNVAQVLYANKKADGKRKSKAIGPATADNEEATAPRPEVH